VLAESRRVVQGGSGSLAEWTYEGRTNSVCSVVPDGNFARYQGSAYFVCGASGHLYAK
jgi:hypothetical protein